MLLTFRTKWTTTHLSPIWNQLVDYFYPGNGQESPPSRRWSERLQEFSELSIHPWTTKSSGNCRLEAQCVDLVIELMDILIIRLDLQSTWTSLMNILVISHWVCECLLNWCPSAVIRRHFSALGDICMSMSPLISWANYSNSLWISFHIDNHRSSIIDHKLYCAKNTANFPQDQFRRSINFSSSYSSSS